MIQCSRLLPAETLAWPLAVAETSQPLYEARCRRNCDSTNAQTTTTDANFEVLGHTVGEIEAETLSCQR